MEQQIENLKKLYANSSKHSNYQMLPDSLIKLLGEDSINVKSRWENERLQFILNSIKIKNKRVLDIGGNSGYFTISLIEKGASIAHHFEGNSFHSEFVKLSSIILNIQNKVQTTNKYYTFDESEKEKYDVVLLLNVLHHLGDDYGERKNDPKNAKESMLVQLNQMASTTNYMAFQLGFNWMGDTTKPLFKNGTKAEIIDFIKGGTGKHWEIIEIGIAESVENNIVYKRPTTNNLRRIDNMGEFLNRPLFILKSKINDSDSPSH